ncbi:MAG: hypothetical protein ACI8X5_004162 [Planctomycetota bacterium]|jgi:hypothetical protein
MMKPAEHWRFDDIPYRFDLTTFRRVTVKRLMSP